MRKKENSFSEKIDRLITHKILGLPIFLAVMFLFFRLRLRGLITPLSDMLDEFLVASLRIG